MKPEAAVEIYSSDSVLVMRPSGLSADGHRFSDRVTLKLTYPLTAEAIGANALRVLDESVALRFPLDCEQLIQRADLLLTDLLSNLGCPDLAAAVRAARHVAIVRYGHQLDIEHSEAHGGKFPGFKRLTKAVMLNDPSPEMFGTEILAALQRCTWDDK